MKKNTLYHCLIGLALFATASSSLRAGVIAYYSFDNGLADGSGNANNLTISSGSPNITNVGGESMFGGGALNLDQSGPEDHLSFSAAISFDGSSPWSMSWWGQRSASALGSQGMIAGTIVNSNNFVWTPDNPSVVRGIRLRNGSGANAQFNGIIDDNAFHHWAVSYDGAGQVTMYRDNSPLGTLNWAGNINLTHVGAGTANQSNSFYGQIDELYVFDEAIDARIVNNLFSSNTVPEPSSALLIGLGGLALLRRRRRVYRGGDNE